MKLRLRHPPCRNLRIHHRHGSKDSCPHSTSPSPSMSLPLHHAEVPVITNPRAVRPSLPLRRHTINRTSLRSQRTPTFTSKNDQSHQQKRHRKHSNSHRQLGTRERVFYSHPPHRQNPSFSGTTVIRSVSSRPRRDLPLTVLRDELVGRRREISLRTCIPPNETFRSLKLYISLELLNLVLPYHFAMLQNPRRRSVTCLCPENS